MYCTKPLKETAQHSVVCTKLPIIIYPKWSLSTVDNGNSLKELIFEGGEEVYNEGFGSTKTSITPSSICVTFFIDGLNEGSS